jgi:5'-nucleotidase
LGVKILISNDDGIFSPGIHALALAMSTIATEVLIVAPDIEQSASGHALTLRRPLRYKQTHLKGLPEHVTAYRVDGTPADCVMLGVHNGGQPDVVVSGINLGSNLGFDVTSSGTVAAALEGTSMGIPSIAFSLEISDSLDFGFAADFAAELVPQVVKAGLPAQTLLNVNFPKQKPKAVRLARQSTHNWEDFYVERQDPNGVPYFWLGGTLKGSEEPDTDYAAIKAGYTAITPLHLDMTHNSYFANLAKFVPGLEPS